MDKPLKWKGWVITCLTLVIILMISSVTVIGYRVSSVYTHLTDPAQTVAADQTYLNSVGFDKEEFLSRYDNRTVTLNSSEYDHTFDGHLFSPKTSSKGTVVMAHGLGGSKQSVYPVAALFLDMGYDVFAIDLPNAGSSTSRLNTFGVRESYDVLDAVRYISEKSDKALILWGMSYGGAAAAIAAGRDDSDIDYLILDSPLGDPEYMIDKGLDFIEQSSPVSPELLKRASDLYTTGRYGFSIKSMNAAAWLSQSSIPVLVLSSDSDEVTPLFMAEALYNASHHQDSRLIKFHDVSHAMMYYEEPKQYTQAINQFLN